jgi:uncharacterized membrane protein
MKDNKQKHRVKYLFGLVAMMYPLLVFCALVIFNLPIRYLSIGIIIFAIAYSAVNAKHYRGKHTAALIISPLILIVIGSVSLFIDSSFAIKHFPVLTKLNPELILKLYPALADLAYVTIFTTSFFVPPVFAYYFIEIFDLKIKDKFPAADFERYCFRATLAWVIFFVLDAAVAVLTAFFASSKVWAIYNTGISYVLMGIIFAGEFIIIKIIEKKRRLTAVKTEEPHADS